jgi:hypothetical protein
VIHNENSNGSAGFHAILPWTRQAIEFSTLFMLAAAGATFQ